MMRSVLGNRIPAPVATVHDGPARCDDMVNSSRPRFLLMLDPAPHRGVPPEMDTPRATAGATS